MKWFLNLPTRAKLLFGFGVTGLFLVAVIVTSYTSIRSIQESQRRLHKEDFSRAVVERYRV